MVQQSVRIICRTCGSEFITRDAWAEWDAGQQEWVLGALYDYAYCNDCEDETRLEEISIFGGPLEDQL